MNYIQSNLLFNPNQILQTSLDKYIHVQSNEIVTTKVIQSCTPAYHSGCLFLVLFYSDGIYLLNLQ